MCHKLSNVFVSNIRWDKSHVTSYVVGVVLTQTRFAKLCRITINITSFSQKQTNRYKNIID